jgi:uncharacterized membrane protein
MRDQIHTSGEGNRMQPERLMAFSDGVIAIIITIMVLELKPPHGGDLSALLPLAPIFLSYVLSFLYVAIYWNNHHHLLQTRPTVNGSVLWANMNLLFWLSLIPFATAWMGENHFDRVPTAFYGVSLMMPAIAYYLLEQAIKRQEDDDGMLTRALDQDWKDRLSPVLYMAGIGMAFVAPWIAQVIYVSVALMWLVPDRRIERVIEEEEEKMEAEGTRPS